jgi:hypothetical protein
MEIIDETVNIIFFDNDILYGTELYSQGIKNGTIIGFSQEITDYSYIIRVRYKENYWKEFTFYFDSNGILISDFINSNGYEHQDMYKKNEEYYIKK